MKIYRRLILTYIDKYKTLDSMLLAKEFSMTEEQIINIAYSLRDAGYLNVQNQEYTITEQGRRLIFPMWNDWSIFFQDNHEKQHDFQWNYLYIPPNMI